MGLKIIGLNTMRKNLRTLAEKYPDRVAAAIYKEAQIEMTEAKKRTPVAPVDGGTLRASGMVHDPVREGNNISVLLSFGGAAQEYAIAVHEHLSEHSPPSWIIAEENGGIEWNAAGTGPKFLEGPLNESRPYMAARIGKRIKF